MSKRLNKRQQREQEELEQLKAQEEEATAVVEYEDSSDQEQAGGVVNAFAALNAREIDSSDEEQEDDPEVAVSIPKKSKKKKNKKKKPAAVPGILDDSSSDAVTPAVSTPGKTSKKKKGEKADPLDGMDEVDRALAELNMKSGGTGIEDTAGTAQSASGGESRKYMAFRNLLSVDPKNLDADAELRRFFGSKVIASSAQTSSKSHRAGPSSKLRYTISKPKPSYPPSTSLAGLTMQDYKVEDIEELYERRGLEMSDEGEKWFSFEHAGQWREIERQFMGAVRSHDPNELMALLQVFPWHVDTLLQMSEVYRLQSDIGAASDYAERALYAFDRCLMPSFSVSSGTSRLDFDRVENRPMFTALHRIISYLGRRGCWVTAFNFAKLLFALDPLGDPHGAAFWLDFLAIKSGNGSWVTGMLDQSNTTPAAAAFTAYPGMAFAEALALRAEETAAKSKDHTKSDQALLEAIQAFPQVVVPMADKIGATLPDGARQKPHFQVEVGYSDTPSNVMHLLAHIYVSRSEALWKEASLLSWFEQSVASSLFTLDSTEAKSRQADALAMIQMPRDPVDTELNVPLFICRHVLCSESTSWLGFLPPAIKNKPFHAYDPLPPYTATTSYNNDYFSGIKPSRGPSRGGEHAGLQNGLEGFMGRLLETLQTNPTDWRERVVGAWREMAGGREFAHMPAEQRDGLLQQVLQFAGGMVEGNEGGGEGGMPGGFPGRAEEDH